MVASLAPSLVFFCLYVFLLSLVSNIGKGEEEGALQMLAIHIKLMIHSISGEPLTPQSPSGHNIKVFDDICVGVRITVRL